MKTLSSLKNNRKSELERYLKNKKYPDYVKVLDEMVSDPKTKSLVEDGFGGYLGDIQLNFSEKHISVKRLLPTQNEMKEVIAVKNDIFTLFTNKKTEWTVVDQYFDESLHQKDGEQKQLMELIQNRDKYDLLLVHNLNDVHWRTANFCKIREQLHLDIYSLQEGFLKYRKDNDK